jgi:hypothetical protein
MVVRHRQKAQRRHHPKHPVNLMTAVMAVTVMAVTVMAVTVMAVMVVTVMVASDKEKKNEASSPAANHR